MLIRLLAVICCQALLLGKTRRDLSAAFRNGYTVELIAFRLTGGRRFRIPVRGENDAELPPNLLVCLAAFDPDQDWYGGRAMEGA